MTVLLVPQVKITDEKLVDESVLHLMNSLLNSDFKSMNNLQSLSDHAQYGGASKDTGDADGVPEGPSDVNVSKVVQDVMKKFAELLLGPNIKDLIAWANASSEPMPGQDFSMFIIKIVKYKIQKFLARATMMYGEYTDVRGESFKTATVKAAKNAGKGVGIGIVSGVILGSLSDGIQEGVALMTSEYRESFLQFAEKMRTDDVVFRSIVNFCYACEKCVIRSALIKDPINSNISKESLDAKVNTHVATWINGLKSGDMIKQCYEAQNITPLLGLPEWFTISALKDMGDFQSIFELVSTLLPIITEYIDEREYNNMMNMMNNETPYITWTGFKYLIMDDEKYEKMNYVSDAGKSDFQFEDGVENYKPPNAQVLYGAKWKSTHIEGGKLKIQFYYFIKSAVQLIFTFADICVLLGCISYMWSTDLNNTSPLKLLGVEVPGVQTNYFMVFKAAIDVFDDKVPIFLRRMYRHKRDPGGAFFMDIMGVIALLYGLLANMSRGPVSFAGVDIDISGFAGVFSTIMNAIAFALSVVMTYKNIRGAANVAWDISFGAEFAKEIGSFHKTLSSEYIQNTQVTMTTGPVNIQSDIIWRRDRMSERLSERLETFKQDMDRHKSNIKSHQGTIIQKTKEIGVLNDEIIRLNTAIATANKDLQTANKDLQTAKKDLQTAKKDLQTAKKDLQTANKAVAAEKSGTSEKTGWAWIGIGTATASRTATENEKKVKALGETIKALGETIKALEETIKALEETIKKFNNELKKFNNELLGATASRDRLDGEFAAAQMAIVSEEAKMSKLETEIKRLRGRVDRINREIDASDNANQIDRLKTSGGEDEEIEAVDNSNPTDQLKTGDEDDGSTGIAAFTDTVASTMYGVVRPVIAKQLQDFKEYVAKQLSGFLKNCKIFKNMMVQFKRTLYCVCLKILISALSKIDITSIGAKSVSALSRITSFVLKTSSVISKKIAKHNDKYKPIQQRIDDIKADIGCGYDKVMIFVEKYLDNVKLREDKFIDASVNFVFTFGDKPRYKQLYDGVSILTDLFPSYIKYSLLPSCAAVAYVIMPSVYEKIPSYAINGGVLIAICITVVMACKHVPGLLPGIKNIAMSATKSSQPNPMLFPGQRGGEYELSISGDIRQLTIDIEHMRGAITTTGNRTESGDIMKLVEVLELPVTEAILQILENADNRNIQDVVRDIMAADSVGTDNSRRVVDPEIERLNGGGLYKTIIDPHTHAKYFTDSKEGMRVLKKLSRVIMNTVIVDPSTGKSVCAYSKEGMNILNSYMSNI